MGPKYSFGSISINNPIGNYISASDINYQYSMNIAEEDIRQGRYKQFTISLDNGKTISMEELLKIATGYFETQALVEEFPQVKYHYDTFMAMVKLHSVNS